MGTLSKINNEIIHLEIICIVIIQRYCVCSEFDLAKK